jgi:hypothetical protein
MNPTERFNGEARTDALPAGPVNPAAPTGPGGEGPGRTETACDITLPSQDFPAPPALSATADFIWDDGLPAAENYAAFGRVLNAAGDLFRVADYGGGLILVSGSSTVRAEPITEGRRLAAVALDRVRVRHVKEGRVKGRTVPASHLSPMLRAECFLQQFRPLDAVCRSPRYHGDFELTRPGYNNCGPGQRILHVGDAPRVERSLDATNAFLDVMDFASAADRTNAVAAKLTVLLRNFWPGAKPLLQVTSTKSHGGKETVILFAAGSTPWVSISYQTTDWALERNVVGALNQGPDKGVLIVENARLDRGQPHISSAYLERFVTDPEPLLFSTGTGGPVCRRNDVVVALSTNYGRVSEDLLNRALPIHLVPVGDVARRAPAIGNPKLEYLPAQCERLEAECRGMVERWKEAGRPLDNAVRHPFVDWARTIGGILAANGFRDFLANYSLRRTAHDPVRQALGLLGAVKPDRWLPAGRWAEHAIDLGLVAVVIPPADRANEKARERGIGVVLSAHIEEFFVIETDAERLTLRLEKARRRFDEGKPSWRYRFTVTDREELPADGVQQG